MEPDLAELIRDSHRNEGIWPYVWLRSLDVLEPDKRVPQSVAEDKFGEDAIKVLSISGFVRIVDGKIHLRREDGTWLYQPAAPPKRRVPGESNFDKQLDRVAKLAGYPADLTKNRGFYRKRFKLLLDKHGFDRLETIAYDNQGMGFREFLAPGVFKSLEVKWEAEALD